MVKVLFVCMGNICRSPSAEGVFAAIVEREGLSEHIVIDSAGTHAYHIGEPPDPRSQEAARQRGIDLSRQRARRVVAADFIDFDYVLAMDESNFQDLEAIRDPQSRAVFSLFLDFAPENSERNVPDPYYGGGNGFQKVLDLIEVASEGLLADIRQRHEV